jgi:Domain of unknown function (DUF4037)
VTQFVPGLTFNDGFYRDVVAPLLEPWPHQAALLGWGSDVLGLDTERSIDHGWGPRVQVFVDRKDVTEARRAIDAGLPAEYEGWPIAYGWDDTPVRHHVEVTTLDEWLSEQLGYSPLDGMTLADWLVTPQQRLLGVVRGAVYRDDGNELAALRGQLAWYPDELWRWLVACQWKRIAQEEAFVGRTAEVGDELGSRVIAGRLVREIMRLWFLLTREYAPYSKWLGTAFAQLDGASALVPVLERALVAPDHATREAALVEAYEATARRHNDTRITALVDPTVRDYHGRGYRVLMSERFVDACLATISDPWLAALPLVGSVDQVADSTDVLQHPARAARLRSLY